LFLVLSLRRGNTFDVARFSSLFKMVILFILFKSHLTSLKGTVVCSPGMTIYVGWHASLFINKQEYPFSCKTGSYGPRFNQFNQ
jgi:hypothetical protein